MIDQCKTSCFHRVNNTIISVCLVRNSEGKLGMWLELSLSYHLDSLLIVWALYFEKWWITEEDGRWTTWNWAVV
jgi:hypothetical protein